MTDIAKYARHYTTLGLALVPIPAGLKGPRESGWNEPHNTITTRDEAHRKFSGAPLNMGVLHSASGTATLDVDHEEWATQALAAVGVDLTALLDTGTRIKGKNGEKPFYRLPDDCQLDRRSLAWPHPTEVMSNGRPKLITVLEFRAGGVQDVLPPSIHPDTGRAYEWAGTPPRTREDIPLLPDALRRIWENWEESVVVMRQACPWAAPEQPAKVRQTPTRTSTPDDTTLRPGDAFRERVNIRTVLERNGYRRKGERYLPPDSKTKVAGVRILTGEDGVERAFSDHGSCPLNDEHAHDSFSALILLEHAGNVTAAVKAAAQELGMERPALPPTPRPEPLTAEQVQAQWSAAQSELITQGCMVLDAAQGNPKQKSALFDLWAALTELACTNIWERKGKFYINPGGLLNLKNHGITGRPADISTRLRYLGTLGFHRGVTKTDPNDPNSALLIEVPASPRELPFMALTQEASKSLTVQVPTYAQRSAKTSRTFITTSKARPKGSYEDVGRFVAVAQTVAWLLAVPDATTSELADMRGKAVRTMQAHVRLLRAAGMVKVEKRRISLTATWAQLREVLRLERENDPAFRARIRKALERTIRYCKSSIFAPTALPAPQLKRRKSMLQVATLRLERLDAGEPISEVMKWAA